MAKTVMVEMRDLEKFVQKAEAAGNSEFKRELTRFLEALGEEFIRVLEDEIIRLRVVDTRLLLHSFHKGATDNVWKLSEGNLTLEIGTNVKYAQWVEDGHFQKPGRFIPGELRGDKFHYNPGAKTGMVLKASYVEGRHYFDHAIRIMEHMLPELLERKINEWLGADFGGSAE